MLRNREIRRLLLFCGIVTSAGAGAAFCFSFPAGIAALASLLLLCAGFFLFTFWRYRELARLSAYLSRVRAGLDSLDIREGREGELSILKNDIYKLTRTLSEQAELLKKDREYLADALADISHQLKTPLTSLLMMTDLLSSPGLSEEKRREFTACIRSQLERIEWLVSSLLKISKIDAGAVEFHPQETDARSLIEKALEPLRIPMELKEQSLFLEGAEGVSLFCDPGWTAEALVNVLKNCVEHTPAGGSIRIEYAENPLHTAILIRDSGPGIPPEDLPHIFERFYKGKNAAPESVGIGLAMASSILHAQNAGLAAESPAAGGALFTLKFYKQIL